jgi:hypothetical protein
MTGFAFGAWMAFSKIPENSLMTDPGFGGIAGKEASGRLA